MYGRKVTCKVFIKTFGCQMNEYDSQRMSDVLCSGTDWSRTENISQADVILLNTCSVREKAAEKVFDDLGRIRRLKQGRPDMLVGVGGCVASQEGERIAERAPFVDFVFGPQTIHRIPQLIEERRRKGCVQIDVSFPAIEKFDSLPPPSVDGPMAFVSVMEGCSKYCSFCVVPYTRGEEVSRPIEGVLAEIAGIADQGVREVTLLGQNVNAYRAETREGDPCDFAFLLRCVSRVPGIERIRFTTSHPLEFGERLVKEFAENPALANCVHLPVQSGSDRVLAAMKRGYTALEYKSIVRKLRRIRSDILLTSDFIVGFPGETADDFERTLDLVREVGFDFSYSFLYSPRPGTPAARLPNDTPLEVRKERLAILQNLLESQGRAVSKGLVGTVQSVLVEGSSKRDPSEFTGRAGNNRVVNFEGAPWLAGAFVDLLITEARAHTLRGEPLRRQESLASRPSISH